MQDKEYTLRFELMKAYAKLPIMERKIIEWLNDNGVFNGGYSDFTRYALNVDVNKNVSNVRKAFLNLNDKHIIYIELFENKKPYFGLTPCWQTDLLFDYKYKK